MKNPLRTLKRVIRQPVDRFERTLLLRRLLDQQFTQAGVTPPKVRFVYSRQVRLRSDALILREPAAFVVHISQETSTSQLRFLGPRIAPFVRWFSRTGQEIRRISVNLSDGHEPSEATYRFSTTPNVGAPVPDPYYFVTRGYQRIRETATKQSAPWRDRTDEIVWRGAPNNTGFFSLDPDLASNPAVMQRLRLVLACRNLDIDAQFFGGGNPQVRHLIKTAGLAGDFIPPERWLNMKYAIDIDGFTNAWNNFMQRLLLGCCILKVESQHGFYQWYYPELKPWEHFVPVRADLADLAEKAEWVRSNQGRAEEIAMTGQAFARSMTLESETARAAQIIEENEMQT